MPIRGMEDKRERDQTKLKELAFLDDLTSLYNRRYLYEYLPTELKDVQKLKKQLCLLIIDVDSFKQVNDTYGHLCGDKILLKISQVLRKNLRQGDTIVRYAGDEFIAVLPGAGEDVAVNIAQRIHGEIEKSSFKSEEGTDIHLTISVGLAIFPRDAQSPEKLIHQADRALYSCKRGGRNRICTVKDITEEVLDETKLQEIFAHPRLIDRQRQLEKLINLLTEADKGRPKFALVEGGRGMGKSRLLAEFKKITQEKQLLQVSISCSPEMSTQPYQSLISTLENLFNTLGSSMHKFMRALPEAQIRQLANYIPSLKQFLPAEFQAPKVFDRAQAQIDLFKGIVKSLIYMVKTNTLLLIFDDFHWVDKETLKFLHYMVKDLESVPIFIVAAYRSSELERRTEGASVKRLIEEMKQDKLVQELTLEPLARENILEMITAFFSGIQVIPKFVDIIYNVSGGNPLFTEEILRSLVNKKFIFYKYGKWHAREIVEATFPPFLKEAIQKRIDALDEETKPVVAAAAVIGEFFDFDILCQLLEKNPGYILEQLDRASEQQLLMPLSPWQTERFRFNSEIIRELIYAGIEPAARQSLHRRLALIEEKAHQDNIVSVVGRLGYHFGQAQDVEKQSLYSSMLLERASQMPTYEDIFSFLQEALLEQVEEIVVPLSDTGMKLMPPAIRTLRLAIQNVRLYPAHSSLRKGFIQQAFKYLSEILSVDDTFIIGTAENRLLINGEEISRKAQRAAGADAFITIMIDYRIKSITFKKGLSEEELAIFLEGISEDYDDLLAEGGLSGILRKNEVAHIKVNEIRYEQTSKLNKQRTRLEEAMLVDYLLGKIAQPGTAELDTAYQLASDPQRLSQALERIAEQTEVKAGQNRTQAQAELIAQSLQRLGEVSQDKIEPETYRKNIARAIRGLDFKLRSKVIQLPLKGDHNLTLKQEAKDVIAQAVAEFSDEEIWELVKNEYASSRDNLVNLHYLLRRFLVSPERKKQLLPKLKDNLRQLGLSKEEVSWVVGEELWQGLSLKEKAERIVMLPSEDYLKLGVSREVEKIVLGLLENGQYNEAGEIIEKLLKQLESDCPRLRSSTIRDLDKINAILIVKGKYFLLEQIIKGLVNRLDKEEDHPIYNSLVLSLASICTKLLKRYNFVQAKGILREFNLRLKKDTPLKDFQKQIIARIKGEVIAATQMLTWLTQLLKEKIEGRHDFWELAEVIHEIGPSAIGPVFALAVVKDNYADPFKTYAFRWNIAKVLKGMGEEAVLYLKDRLASERKELIKVVLELLGHMQNPQAARYLGPLLKHKDLSIRQESITTLGKIGGPEAVQLLSAAIKDKNSKIRLAAIWALANIGSPDVLRLLRPLLAEKELAPQVARIIQRMEKGR